MENLRCPVSGCDAQLVVAGSVFCESGEYDQHRGEYAAEGDAAVYRCEAGHAFAFDPPCADDDEENA